MSYTPSERVMGVSLALNLLIAQAVGNFYEPENGERQGLALQWQLKSGVRPSNLIRQS